MKKLTQLVKIMSIASVGIVAMVNNAFAATEENTIENTTETTKVEAIVDNNDHAESFVEDSKAIEVKETTEVEVEKTVKKDEENVEIAEEETAEGAVENSKEENVIEETVENKEEKVTETVEVSENNEDSKGNDVAEEKPAIDKKNSGKVELKTGSYLEIPEWDEPEEPKEPSKPEKPTEPKKPSEPTQPVEPEEPIKPVEPKKTIESEEPTAPSPVEPVYPVVTRVEKPREKTVEEPEVFKETVEEPVEIEEIAIPVTGEEEKEEIVNVPEIPQEEDLMNVPETDIDLSSSLSVMYVALVVLVVSCALLYREERLSKQIK